MSEQEQQRLRQQAWDDYQAALQSHAASERKLEDLAAALVRASTWLLSGERSVSEIDLLVYPTREDMAHAIEDFKSSEEHLRRCCRAAREFGFPVDAKDCE